MLQYSLWLDQHSTDEVLKFIKGALVSTASKVEKDEPTAQLIDVMLQICDQSRWVLTLDDTVQIW